MRLFSPPPEPDPLTFEPTLRAARAGDLLAYNRLVLEHEDVVYNLAYRVLGDATAAAEATQVAFVSALRELRGCPAGAFRMWVLCWLVRACQPRLGRRSHPAEPAASLPGCLAALPPAQRLALALVDIAGLDYAQAAGVLALKPDQLRHDLAAARRTLGTVTTR